MMALYILAALEKTDWTTIGLRLHVDLLSAGYVDKCCRVRMSMLEQLENRTVDEHSHKSKIEGADLFGSDEGLVEDLVGDLVEDLEEDLVEDLVEDVVEDLVDPFDHYDYIDDNVLFEIGNGGEQLWR